MRPFAESIFDNDQALMSDAGVFPAYRRLTNQRQNKGDAAEKPTTPSASLPPLLKNRRGIVVCALPARGTYTFVFPLLE
jgi:hypothetical protein